MDEEVSLLLLVTVDVVSELEYVEEESLLVLSCSLVVLVILGVMLEVFVLPKQPLNTKARVAMITGSFLFLFIVLHYIRTKTIKKDRYFNNGLFNLMV